MTKRVVTNRCGFLDQSMDGGSPIDRSSALLGWVLYLALCLALCLGALFAIPMSSFASDQPSSEPMQEYQELDTMLQQAQQALEALRLERDGLRRKMRAVSLDLSHSNQHISEKEAELVRLEHPGEP